MSADFFINQTSVYTNGLLAANTSKFIASCLKAREQKVTIVLNEENITVLNNAKDFLLSILNGQHFISGKKGGVSVTGIIAFNYAVQTIEYIGLPKRPTDPTALLSFFKNILTVLEKLSESKLMSVSETNLILAKEFFSKLADVFLDKIQTYSRSESKIFQTL